MADEEFVDCIEGPPLSINGNGEVSEESAKEEKEFNHVFTQMRMSEEKVKNEGEEAEIFHDPQNLQDDIKMKKEDWGEDVESILKMEKNIDKALEAKEEGNKYFRLKDYDTSAQCYSQAIGFCPETPEHSEQLATFYGNRSAAYFAEDEHELVIEDCTEAIKLKPDYIKVIARRMQSYEKLEKYEEALTDAKKLKELDPSYPKIDSTIGRLQRLYDEKMSKLKDEALGKLKDLGNSLLGNFGLSLDNFKMVQDPNTGGWSISMNNGH